MSAVAQFYVSDTGSDDNDCRSVATACATLQRATDLAPVGKSGILLLCGKPAGQECGFAPVDVSHFKFIAIGGDCSVVGFGRTKIVAPDGNAAIHVQDHATATAQCVAFEGGNGSVGWALRQYAIADCAFCTFRNFLNGVMIAASETSSKFNASSNIYIYGSAAYFVMVGTFSEVTLNATLVFDPVSFSGAVISVSDGKISMPGAAITNNGVTGRQWVLTNGILHKGSVAIPGNVPGVADATSVIR